MDKSIYDLALHESIGVSPDIYVRRVPSGWIYTQYEEGFISPVFVPYDNVFQGREESDATPIVCLCGSSRFYEAYQKANYEFTMQGWIVLSIGWYPHAKEEMHHEEAGCTPEEKIALDELHKRKIDLAQRVHILNIGGYIGDSTRSEIEYAEKNGKLVTWEEE